MSEIILKFNGEEELYEAKRAMGAGDALCAMWDFDQECRSVLKYENHEQLIRKVIAGLEESNKFIASYTTNDPNDTPDKREMHVAPTEQTLRHIIDTVTQHWRSRLWELRSEYNVVEDR